MRSDPSVARRSAAFARCRRARARWSCGGSSLPEAAPTGPVYARPSETLLRNEAHGAGALEDAPPPVLNGPDLLGAHLFGHLVFRQPLALHVAVDQLAGVDDEDGLPFESPPCPP